MDREFIAFIPLAASRANFGTASLASSCLSQSRRRLLRSDATVCLSGARPGLGYEGAIGVQRTWVVIPSPAP